MKLQLWQEMKLHLSEEMKPICQRLEAEHTARNAQADEFVKCQNDLERYKDLFAHEQLRNSNLTQRSEQLERSYKTAEEAKISEETKCENLQQEYDRLCTRVHQLENDNGGLRSVISNLEFDDALNKADIESHQNELKRLQTERTKLLHGLKQTKEENLNMKIIIQALTEQKNNLRDELEIVQAEKANLQIEVTRLVEAKDSLAEQVELLESECTSLQEEITAPDISSTQKSQGHLSTATIDSGIGGSLRDSVVSTRKRQISTSSIGNEHEEKRHRSLQPLGDRDSGILFADPDQDLDPLTLPIMGTSELQPPWNGSGGYAHSRDDGDEMTFI